MLCVGLCVGSDVGFGCWVVHVFQFWEFFFTF